MTLMLEVLDRYCTLDPGRIDAKALDAAKIALADGLSVMVAASALEPATQPFMAYAAAAGAGPSTLIGGSGKSPAVFAALANGALAHAIDFEDTFEEGMIHPNASLIPAVLALAESEKTDGRTILAAIALGCDFACRLSLALDGDPARRGWYHPPILSGLGATLGCAVLLGLDANGARNALGLFAAQFMLADELKRSPKSDLRAVREALAARAAVESALLARAGVEAVEMPLEGQSGVFHILTGRPPRPASLQTIGRYFHGPDVGIKIWPACRGTHSAILAAQRLREKNIAPSAIVRIGVDVMAPNDMLFTPRAQRIAPATPIDAKFSIPFVLAAAMEHGTVSLDHFTAGHLGNPTTLALAGNVHLDAMLPGGGCEAIYRVTLADGSIHTEIIETVPVWRTGGISLSDLAGKVSSCLRLGRKPVDPARFLEAVESIGENGSEALMSLL